MIKNRCRAFGFAAVLLPERKSDEKRQKKGNGNCEAGKRVLKLILYCFCKQSGRKVSAEQSKENEKMSLWKRGLTVLMAAALALSACACGAAGENGEPVEISVWSYYNGAQLAMFNELIEEFNETVGQEKGITVTSGSFGDINELSDRVMDAVEKKAGADEVPNIFSAYADTAVSLDAMGIVADLAPYLSKEERAQYVGGFLEEGDFHGDGSLKIFPVAKATEVFLLNKTDWELFAAATGASYEDFSTVEGLTALSEKYYRWTDTMTDTPNDGKAFFGRDAMDNYFYISAMQLGEELLAVEDGKATLQFSEQTARKLWDHYYVPFVKGYFSASGRFRTDDVKIGNILALVGSSSSASYFPSEVMLEDGTGYPIEMLAFPCPQFEGSEGYAVQQGAGMVVTEADEAEIAASVEFLKWFTQPEQNVRFSVQSGYLPVMKAAYEGEEILTGSGEISPVVEKILKASVQTIRENTAYTPQPFPQGDAVRRLLKYSLSDLAGVNRAAVLERVAGGMSMEEAIAEFTSEERFQNWYQTTVETIEATIAQ